MPSQAEHFYKAVNNKLFADAITPSTPTATGWALTALFYSALHYVEAFNAKHNCHFSKHEDLNKDIARNPQLAPIFDDYKDLSELSWNARYQAVKYGKDKVTEAIEYHTAVVNCISPLL
jgi:HEPN domain